MLQGGQDAVAVGVGARQGAQDQDRGFLLVAPPVGVRGGDRGAKKQGGEWGKRESRPDGGTTERRHRRGSLDNRDDNYLHRPV